MAIVRMRDAALSRRLTLQRPKKLRCLNFALQAILSVSKLARRVESRTLNNSGQYWTGFLTPLNFRSGPRPAVYWPSSYLLTRSPSGGLGASDEAAQWFTPM